MKHLMERPEDWADASDEEWVSALLDHPPFLDPFWMAFARYHRPEALRRALLLHADMGGFVGAPARRWLRGGR